MTNYQNVSARAMLATLRISTWAGYKFDKKATRKVNESHGASDKSGRYNKRLLPGAQIHEALINRAGSARAVFYANTLPWSDAGSRILPTANYFEFVKKMRSPTVTREAGRPPWKPERSSVVSADGKTVDATFEMRPSPTMRSSCVPLVVL